MQKESLGDVTVFSNELNVFHISITEGKVARFSTFVHDCDEFPQWLLESEPVGYLYKALGGPVGLSCDRDKLLVVMNDDTTEYKFPMPEGTKILHLLGDAIRLGRLSAPARRDDISPLR